MNRFLSALRQDIRLQWRQGFYGVYGAVTLVFVVFMHMIPLGWRPKALTMVIFTDPAVLGLYMVGGIVMLERDQHILEGLFATPIRLKEYFWAKIVSMTLIALASSLIVTVATFGIRFHLLPMLLGVCLTSAVFILIGFTLVGTAKSLNNYLLLSGLYMSILQLPLIGWFGLVPLPWFSPLPTTASLVLLDWMTMKQNPAWVAYSLIWLTVSGWLAWIWARNVFETRVLNRVGGHR